MSVKKRYKLRKSEIKRLRSEICEKLGEKAGTIVGEDIEILGFEDGVDIILTGGKEVLFRSADGIFPVLPAAQVFSLQQVVVDMGAVPHVVNGADIMGPGVVSAGSDIKPEEIVVVVDERHGKPLAIGIALVPGVEMRAKGKVVKNIHYVGDKVWRSLLEKG